MRAPTDSVKDLERLNSESRVSFQIDMETLALADRQQIPVHLGLLEEALWCVLDNAAKFSEPDTIVRVGGGLERERFYIVVTNVGLRISARDIHRLADWGVRGRQALWVVGEGSGLGLWITKRIMTVHRGNLKLEPTDSHGFTRVKLIFQK